VAQLQEAGGATSWGPAAARGAWCWEREGKDEEAKDEVTKVLGRFWAGPNVEEISCAALAAC
jgi:hypothetical protein